MLSSAFIWWQWLCQRAIKFQNLPGVLCSRAASGISVQQSAKSWTFQHFEKTNLSDAKEIGTLAILQTCFKTFLICSNILLFVSHVSVIISRKMEASDYTWGSRSSEYKYLAWDLESSSSQGCISIYVHFQQAHKQGTSLGDLLWFTSTRGDIFNHLCYSHVEQCFLVSRRVSLWFIALKNLKIKNLHSNNIFPKWKTKIKTPQNIIKKDTVTFNCTAFTFHPVPDKPLSKLSWCVLNWTNLINEISLTVTSYSCEIAILTEMHITLHSESLVSACYFSF